MFDIRELRELTNKYEKQKKELEKKQQQHEKEEKQKEQAKKFLRNEWNEIKIRAARGEKKIYLYAVPNKDWDFLHSDLPRTDSVWGFTKTLVQVCREVGFNVDINYYKDGYWVNISW